MSYRELKSGKFEVSWRSNACTQKCKNPCPKMGQPHQHTRTVSSRTEASDLDRDMKTGRAAMRKAGIVEPAAPRPAKPASKVRTLRQCGYSATADLETRGVWAAGTASQRRTALRKLSAWADQPITEAATNYDAAQRDVSAQVYPDSMVSVIKRACEHAIRAKLISAHGMTALMADRSRTPEVRREFLETTDAQVTAIGDHLDEWIPGVGLTMNLMRDCGMRPGEVFALESADFADDYTAVTIARQVDAKGRVLSLKGKRAHERRTVPVPARTGALVAAHVAAHGEGRLFRAPRGGSVVSREEWNARSKAGAVKAGQPAEWTPYQLRHLYASVLIRRGVVIDRVAKLLGHASTTVTYRRYSHMFTNELDDIRTILNAA